MQRLAGYSFYYDIENLNCDYTDTNELQSLELALQLQAEELSNVKVVNEGDGYTESQLNV